MSAAIRARRADLEWRLVDEEIVILDLSTQCYLSLNRTGATLWPLIVAGTNRDQLVERLVAAYAIDDGVAVADVDALLGELRDTGLLEAAGDAPAAP